MLEHSPRVLKSGFKWILPFRYGFSGLKNFLTINFKEAQSFVEGKVVFNLKK